MTSPRTLNMLFTIHSWAGIVTGLLLFIVCFSGAVIVFKNEIDRWANPSLAQLPRAAAPASLDTILNNVRTAYPEARVESITLPDAVTPSHFVFVHEKGQPEQQRTKLAVRSDTGALVGPVDSQLGQFLRMLHVFLFFGPRWIVGFLGVAMLVLIGTGFVIHRKIIAELFTQRWGRSLRLVMSDLHKAAGIWGLAFHVVIAFTGAWLGLAPVFENGFAYAMQAKPKAAMRAAAAPAAAMRPLDEARAAVLRAVPDFEPRRIVLRHWERANAEALFVGGLSTHLASTVQVRVEGASAQVKAVRDPRMHGFWSQFNSVMEPLHFGDFGGLALKWLYFVLGLTPAFLSLSGTLIWLDGRRQRLAAGVHGGLPA